MFSPLMRHNVKKNVEKKACDSPALEAIPHRHVRSRISYFETLNKRDEDVSLNKENYKPANRSQSDEPVKQKKPVTQTKPLQTKKVAPQTQKDVSPLPTPAQLSVSVKHPSCLLSHTELISTNKSRFQERELETVVYQEKSVLYVSEQEEIRERKIEILEEKIMSSKKKHRESVQKGDTDKANLYMKKIQTHTEALRNYHCISPLVTPRTVQLQTTTEISVTASDSEDYVEVDKLVTDLQGLLDDDFSTVTEKENESDDSCRKEEESSDEESESFGVDETNLNGDLWGGIVAQVADKLCVDDANAWRTFSCYSVCDNRTHSELVFTERDTIEDHDDFTQEASNSKGLIRIRSSKVNSNDEIIHKHCNDSEEDLVQELGAIRTKLYAALHQQAQTEYKLRLYQSKLAKCHTDILSYENQLEKQKFIINEHEKADMRREIEYLKNETEERKRQVQELRRQIRTSLSSLSESQQSDIRSQILLEDPFIESSILLLESVDTPLEKISIIESRFSTLSCHEQVIISANIKPRNRFNLARKLRKLTKSREFKNTESMSSSEGFFSPKRTLFKKKNKSQDETVNLNFEPMSASTPSKSGASRRFPLFKHKSKGS